MPPLWPIGVIEQIDFVIFAMLRDVSSDLDIDGLVQECSNSIAKALELLQSCTKPLICIQLLAEVPDENVYKSMWFNNSILCHWSQSTMIQLIA